MPASMIFHFLAAHVIWPAALLSWCHSQAHPPCRGFPATVGCIDLWLRPTFSLKCLLSSVLSWHWEKWPIHYFRTPHDNLIICDQELLKYYDTTNLSVFAFNVFLFHCCFHVGVVVGKKMSTDTILSFLRSLWNQLPTLFHLAEHS